MTQSISREALLRVFQRRLRARLRDAEDDDADAAGLRLIDQQDFGANAPVRFATGDCAANVSFAVAMSLG